MTALAFERPDGQAGKVVVRRPGNPTLKQNPLAAEFEYKVLQLTRSLGLAVPAPLYFDPTGEIFPTPYLVIEYIEGQPEFSPTGPDLFTQQMAAHLAQIHSADCSALDCSFLPAPSHAFAGDFTSWAQKVDPIFEVQRIHAALAEGLAHSAAQCPHPAARGLLAG